jgi:hypothetical protein
MYGLIHNSARDYVLAGLGGDKWQQIVRLADLGDDDFLALRSYDDSVMLRLLGAAVEVSGLPLPKLLHGFGRHFIDNMALAHYGGVMATHGQSLWEFLHNLNHMHDSMASSERQGLSDFVIGLIEGLALHFRTPVAISIIEDRSDPSGQNTRFLLEPQ